jgi:hypothetical protein
MSIVLDGTTGLAGAATGALNGTLGATTPSTVAATTVTATTVNAALNGTLGATTPAAVTATTVNTSSLLTANKVVSTLGSYSTSVINNVSSGGTAQTWNYTFDSAQGVYFFFVATNNYEDGVLCMARKGSATITILAGNVVPKFALTAASNNATINLSKSAGSSVLVIIGGAQIAGDVVVTAINCSITSYVRIS